MRDAGYRAIDSLSAEKGYRHWHADLSNSDTPLEAGIGFTVLPRLKRAAAAVAAAEKEAAEGEGGEGDDFLGMAALVAQRAGGVRRKLICLELESADVALHGLETIWRDGECVGYVRSTAFGHSVGRTICYGYVRNAPGGGGGGEAGGKVTNKWLKAGGSWEIGDKGVRHAAALRLKAPFDPTNQRVKGVY